MTDTPARMRQLVGTTADWAANNIVLGSGEIGVEIVSSSDIRLKCGDGTSTWSALSYTGITLVNGKANLSGDNTFTGNQGIGIAPSYPLHVYRPSSSTWARLENGSLVDTYLSFVNTGSSGAEFFVGLSVAGTAASVWDRGARPLIFATNNTERMRIDSGGNFLIGTTNTAVVGGSSGTGFAIYPSGSIAAVASGGFAATFRRLTSDGGVILFGRDATNVGSISVTTTATTYNTSSDYRLKQDAAPMTGALTKVTQLNPVTYKWKINSSDGQGFIAHELAAVIPDAVTGEKDAIDNKGHPIYQGVDLSRVVPTLTAAIKELLAKVDALTARVAALESRP